MSPAYDIVILGLSITSSWGNGHATTFRSLVKGLASLGHSVLFLERDTEWYASNRDMPKPEGADTEIYTSFEELTSKYEAAVRWASAVIVGSFVPDGIRVGEWVTCTARGVTAFYDIDTPVTMAALTSGSSEYITPALVRAYHLYLSFTGGSAVRSIESLHGSPMARPLYCSVDAELYSPTPAETRWDLGYLGTYSEDRQPALESLLLEPARAWPGGRFIVAGPMYPNSLEWPQNVEREIHLSPREHPQFYASQRFTLNITREAMKQAGYSPSVRLFEAGGCASAMISDWWEGLDSFFVPGKEIALSTGPEDTLRWLRDVTEEQRLAMGDAARHRVLTEHTPEIRARQLETYLKEAHDHISSHPARRNGCDRAVPERLAPGLSPQPTGPGTGAELGRTAGGGSDPSGVFESSGKGN